MKDSLLTGFARRFISGFAQVSGSLGVSGDKLDELETAIDEYEETLQAILAARSHLKSLTEKKNGLNAKIKNLIRALARRARSDADVSDAQLAGFGIKVRDNIRTASKTPDTAPFITVEIRRGRKHVISVFDAENSTLRSKPESATGAEIWVYTGDPAEMNEKTIRYIGTATKRKFSFTHDDEEAGKQAHYLARWVNRRGERGGWSNQSSATIAL